MDRTDKILKIAGRVIKIVITTLIFVFIAAFLFRIWTNDYYPKEMKRIHFTDSLAESYKENADTFTAYKQKVRVSYDDKEEGNFFASNTIVVPSADALQTVVRYNDSVFGKLAEKYECDENLLRKDTPFVFSVFACTGSDGGEGYDGVEYAPTEIVEDSFWMYTYEKLCFDGIELDGVYWVRLDIMLNNEERTKLGSIVVYESHEKNSKLEELKIRKSELPK